MKTQFNFISVRPDGKAIPNRKIYFNIKLTVEFGYIFNKNFLSIRTFKNSQTKSDL